ncbi:MAG: YggT family protein [Alphaproteobacteria bacterium]
MGKDIWWSYWYFHIPNYAFAVVFYTLWGRFLLSLFLPPDSKNYIFRWFVRLTDWIVKPVSWITPRVLPPVLLPPIASFWIVVLRVLFYMLMFQAGLTPRPSAPAN